MKCLTFVVGRPPAKFRPAHAVHRRINLGSLRPASPVPQRHRVPPRQGHAVAARKHALDVDGQEQVDQSVGPQDDDLRPEAERRVERVRRVEQVAPLGADAELFPLGQDVTAEAKGYVRQRRLREGECAFKVRYFYLLQISP